MIEFNLQAAGRVAAVSAQFDSTRSYCANYLSAKAADFAISITPEDIAGEREKNAGEYLREGVQLRAFSDAYLETLALQRKLAEALFAYDTLLMHGSAVAVDGEAYLFTAKSGTGKSTHTRLWREAFGQRAVMVNDDKPFLRIAQGRVMVCGSPWNGKHKLGANICVPLRAICILERGEDNTIEQITPQQALPMLMQQSHRPKKKENYPKYLALLNSLTGGVDFYRLRCNMDPSAAIVAYEGMQGK